MIDKVTFLFDRRAAPGGSSVRAGEGMDTATTIRQGLVYRFGRRHYDFSSRTHIMGVLNVTPDSFSDGGRFLSLEKAIAHASAMIRDGADFIDVGGESTRPKGQAYGEGADAVPVQEELRRVMPVIEALVKGTDVPVSIDTCKAAVAERAIAAGAVIVNDISGFTFDPAMPRVVAQGGASAVLMHIKGTPKTMQLSPRYDDLFGEIIAFLRKSIDLGRGAGVEQMMVDPGIGFGKNQQDNLRLINGLATFDALGLPIVIGPSRKSFIGTILGLPIGERLEGTLAAVVACVLNGAHVVRVHDVKEVKRAVLIADAVKRAPA